jgi:hypothetical protein
VRYAASWGQSALLIFGITMSSFAAAEDGADTAKGNAVTSEKLLNSVLGKKLTGVDGSTIQISTSKDSLSREMATAEGALQKLNFVYLNDTLGTVSDARDASRVTGVFRATQQHILISYADGSTELLTPNGSGGLSIETRSSVGIVSCRAFYDEGHVFSLDERKAALAQFARRLGITDTTDNSETQSTCRSISALSLSSALALAPTPTAKRLEMTTLGPMDSTLPEPGVVPAVSPAPSASSLFDEDNGTMAAIPTIDTVPALVPVSPPVKASQAPEQSTAEETPLPAGPKEGSLPAIRPVNVRPSQVLPIDKLPDQVGVTESLSTIAQPSADQAGASSCLAVESDGRHWGFKNRCRYDVQFAYCTMDGGNPLTSCREGSVGGSVAPNGFGVLIADENLRAVNVHHDFRWVACRGGAGEVIARLDHTDPPTGRCVR